MEENKSNLPVEVTPNLAPTVITEMAQEAAKQLLAVVKKGGMIVEVRKQKYLKFEGWQTLGTFMGRAYGAPVTAGADDAEPVYDDGKIIGFKAHAQAWCDGQVISEAVAYCYRNEANWKGKPLFQVASMAQTRASSKALRNVLGWVVTLAGDGIKTTPAEEMEEGPPTDLFVSFCDKIQEANDEDLPGIGKEVGQAHKAGNITEGEYNDLTARGKARRKELDGETKPAKA